MKSYIFIYISAIFLGSCASNSDVQSNSNLFGNTFSKSSAQIREKNEAEYNGWIESFYISSEEEGSFNYKELQGITQSLAALQMKVDEVHKLIYIEKKSLIKRTGASLTPGDKNAVIEDIKSQFFLKLDLTKIPLNDQWYSLPIQDLETCVSALSTHLRTAFVKDIKSAEIKTSLLSRLDEIDIMNQMKNLTSATTVSEGISVLSLIEFLTAEVHHEALMAFKNQYKNQTSEFVFSRIKEVVVINQEDITPGKEIIAQVMIVSSDDARNPIKVEANNGRILEIKDGVAKIAYKAPKSGKVNVSGKITIHNNSWVPYTRVFSKTVKVGI